MGSESFHSTQQRSKQRVTENWTGSEGGANAGAPNHFSNESPHRVSGESPHPVGSTGTEATFSVNTAEWNTFTLPYSDIAMNPTHSPHSPPSRESSTHPPFDRPGAARMRIFDGSSQSTQFFHSSYLSPFNDRARSYPEGPEQHPQVVRQEELDHRESQLNARMAQFETLVRNTKLSLQEKMEEVARREAELEEGEAVVQSQKMSQEERFRLDRNQLENERIELQARKAEMEDRIARRERELLEVAAGRERELTANMEQYRLQLEQRLTDYKGDYQKRFEKKCDEIENAFTVRLNEEKRRFEGQIKQFEREYFEKTVENEQVWNEKREELQRRYEEHLTENDRQFALRKTELESTFERYQQRIDEENAARRTEAETRFARREEQIKARENIIRQAEAEWDARREVFENQWAEFERFRQESTETLTAREAKVAEREQFASDTEARQHQRELEQAAFDENLKNRERIVQTDAKKYANLKEMEKDVLDAQAEAARLREGLVRERHQMQKSIETERTRFRESQEIALRRLEEERTELTSQNKKLEQMRLAMDRSREELGRMHRETLEIRLATEELWLRLAGDSAPDELKESLTRIRTRLAEQYQEAVRRLDRQKIELKTAREQVLEQHEKTLKRREELDQWAARSEKLLAEREAALREKEVEIERRQTSVDDLVRRCRAERTEMENEVKLLQAQVEQVLERKHAA